MQLVIKMFGDSDPTQYNTGLPHAVASGSQLHNILEIVIGVVAALSVLIIVIAGLRFITAQGNPQEVSKARGAVIHALIGLVVALLAQSIVSFALSKL